MDGVVARCVRAVVGLGIGGGFCALVAWGLDWGVPSRRRAALEGGVERIRSVPRELIEASWRHWGSRGRRTEEAKGFPRHLFNPVRSYHPDEYQVFKSLSNMEPGRVNFDPGNYIYPALHTYLVGAALGVASLAGGARLERNIEFYFERPEEMGRLYVVGRALSLAAAAATLLLLWRLGGGGVGLLAMGLLAAMPAFGVHAHHLTRDTCAALATLLLFACCRRVARDWTAKWFDLAGAVAGLCVAFQYFAVAAWVLVPVAGALGRRLHDGRRRTVLGRSAASLVLLLVVFAVTNPYHVLNAGQFLADFRSETGHVGAGGVLERLSPVRLFGHLFGMLPALVTWPLAVVLFLGVVIAAARHEADDVLLLVWLVVWAAVVGFDGRTYSRYYVPLLPCLALVSARGLAYAAAGLHEVVEAGWVQAGVGAVALAAVLWLPAGMTVGWARLYAKENVRTLAGEGIAAQVPAGARVGMTKWPWQFEMPPLDPLRHPHVVLEDSPGGRPHDLERLRSLRPEYVVTSSLQYGTIRSDPEIRSPADEFWYEVLVRGQDYVVCREYRVPLEVFGREIDLASYPEDMRYVNPEIVVLQWSGIEAVALGPGSAGGP
jgi:hypothetical protein